VLFHEEEEIQSSARVIAARLGGGPLAGAAILGTGWSAAVGLLEAPVSISFEDVAGLAACGAPGHRGEIFAGSLGPDRWLFFSGRRHLYEGCSAGEVGVPVALARALGADRLLLTCAAGATGEDLAPGALVLIEDHLNLTGENPLLTVPVARRRPSFLPMGNAYDPAALALAERLALPGRIPRAVLASLPGPSFETPAEYRMLARLGAGIVSMSCVLETITARALGMRVMGLAIVANGPARPGEGEGADGHAVVAMVESAVSERLGLLRELLAGFARL
jgi:purine-nucleoside phosphorylase